MPKIKVYSGGESLYLDVDLYDTVEAVKKLVEDKTNVPVARQQLIYSKDLLSDNDEQLISLNLKQDSELIMVPKVSRSDCKNDLTYNSDGSVVDPKAFQLQVQQNFNLMGQLLIVNPNMINAILNKDDTIVQDILRDMHDRIPTPLIRKDGDMEINQKLHDYREKMKSVSSRIPRIEDLHLPYTIVTATHLPSSLVEKLLEQVLKDCTEIEDDGRESYTFTCLSRTKEYQVFVTSLERYVLKEHRYSRKSEKSIGRLTKSIIEQMHKACREKVYIFKRAVYYAHVTTATDQGQTDGIIEDIACMLRCTRLSLPVVASEKGLIVGKVTYEENGHELDLTTNGKRIPNRVDLITNIQCQGANFILLVEKDTVFEFLCQIKFYEIFPCIIITGKGMPDVGTRSLLRRLKKELQLPVFALMDCDPHGIEIMSVYRHGSKNMSYDSENLVTPDIKWLGVRPSDISEFSISEDCISPLTIKEAEMLECLLEDKKSAVAYHKEWRAEVSMMLKKNQKVEIESLNCHGFMFLIDYLRHKLKNEDFL